MIQDGGGARCHSCFAFGRWKRRVEGRKVGRWWLVIGGAVHRCHLRRAEGREEFIRNERVELQAAPAEMIAGGSQIPGVDP